MLYTIIKLNGIYDILCSLSILRLIHIPLLDRIHLQMILYNKYNRLFERYFAYWILTYGCMRLSNDNRTIQVSYFLEALCIANELYIGNTIQKEKALFVIIVSSGIGLLL